jgi:hypothetical protein
VEKMLDKGEKQKKGKHKEWKEKGREQVREMVKRRNRYKGNIENC